MTKQTIKGTAKISGIEGAFQVESRSMEQKPVPIPMLTSFATCAFSDLKAYVNVTLREAPLNALVSGQRIYIAPHPDHPIEASKIGWWMVYVVISPIEMILWRPI